MAPGASAPSPFQGEGWGEVSRRGLLALGAATALGWAMRPKTALGAVSIRGKHEAPPDHVLVTIFLRGGADGLSLVAPYADDHYYSMRPTISLARPSDRGVGAADRLLNLDGFFGLNPALAPLMPLYDAGHLALIHACGSGDETRSHFEAMATMERGLYREDGPASGWLARHLDTAPWENRTPLRAVALGSLVPDSLRGATNATALNRVDEIKLVSSFPEGQDVIRERLAALYGADPHFGPGKSTTAATLASTPRPPILGGQDRTHTGRTEPRGLVEEAGVEALAVLQAIENLSPSTYVAANGAVYPKDDLGEGLRQTALLIKSGLGMEVACLDHGGFDTHVTQGSSRGALAGRLQSLSNSVAAFAQDLGPGRWAKVTVVVLSEFGRRIEENSGLGTDHGHGGVMMVLGGKGIAGHRIHGRWPGLHELDGPGDLKVTTDYRNVLGEILSKRLGNDALTDVFPGLDYRPVGVVSG